MAVDYWIGGSAAALHPEHQLSATLTHRLLGQFHTAHHGDSAAHQCAGVGGPEFH